MSQHAQLNHIEALIAALKTERQSLERRLALLRSQQDFLDHAIQLYFNLWDLKRAVGLRMLELPPIETELLGNLLGFDVIGQQSEAIEEQLSQLVKERHYITFAEIEGTLPVIDNVIESLENTKTEIADGEISAPRRAKDLAGKVMNLGGGAALIGVDLPTLELTSLIGGTLLIRTALRHD